MTRPKKSKLIRQTYDLDQATLKDLAMIQEAARASSAVEAVRLAIRKMADLIRHCDKGHSILVGQTSGETMMVDIPTRFGRRPELPELPQAAAQ